MKMLLSLILVVSMQLVFAEGISPTGAVPAGPDQVLQQGVDILQRFLAKGSQADKKVLEQFVNKQISPLFDFEEMSRFAGGPYYRDFNHTDKKHFRDQLETMFLTAIIQQMATYNAAVQPRVEIFPMRFRSPTRAEAFARVISPNGKMKKLRFLLNKGSGGWKIVDVSANGKSAVIYYRNFFFREARKNGPQAILKLF